MSYLNLGLLSALAAVYQNNENQKQLVSIISVSAALVLFSGILLFHVFLHFRCTKRFKKMLKKFGHNASEESERLLEDEGGIVEQLVEPTTSEVCLRRESLIYSRIMLPANSYQIISQFAYTTHTTNNVTILKLAVLQIFIPFILIVCVSACVVLHNLNDTLKVN